MSEHAEIIRNVRAILTDAFHSRGYEASAVGNGTGAAAYWDSEALANDLLTRYEKSPS